MVAALLSTADILARPAVRVRQADMLTRRFAPMVRDFAQSFGGMRTLMTTGAEVIANGIDEASMSFPAIISTADIDRVGDLLVPEGCDASYYQDNALVFLNHKSERIPLGVSVDVMNRLHLAIEPGRVLSRCFCVQGGEYGQDAADIFHLIVNRAFNDVSVGFNPDSDPRFTQKLDTGGNRYDRWELLEWSVVGIGCNRAAKIIRKYLSDGRITGKRISPQLTKMLTPLAEPKPAIATSGFAAPAAPPTQSQPDTTKGTRRLVKRWSKPGRGKRHKHIRHEASRPAGHQWVLYDHTGSKVLGTHPTKEEAEAQERAIQEHKSLSASSGTAGGYAVAEDVKPDQDEERKSMDDSSDDGDEEATPQETIKAINSVMDEHKKDAHSEGPHDAYFHPEKAIVFHHHHKNADAEHLKSVKDGLDNADGVDHAEQGTEAPTEKGYLKVYDGSGRSGPVEKKKKPAKRGSAPSSEDEFWRRYEGALDAGYDSTQAAAIAHGGGDGKGIDDYRRKAQLAYHLGRGKAFLVMAKSLPKAKKDALESCVHRKIPKIAEDHPDMEDAQRTAVAYSMCGEKAFDDYENKDAADGDPLPSEQEVPAGDTDTAAEPAPAAPIPEDTADQKQPPSLTLCQQAIENIEAALPGMEPETREFWEDILTQIRDHGKERYPQEDFGGEETEAESTTEEDSQDAADDADDIADAYRRTPEEKAADRMLKKSLRELRKGDGPRVLKSVGDHLHMIADMPLNRTLRKSEKDATKEHARAVDALYGAVTHGMKAEPEMEAPPEEEKPEAVEKDEPTEGDTSDMGGEDTAQADVEKLLAGMTRKAVAATADGDGAKCLDSVLKRFEGITGTRLRSA